MKEYIPRQARKPIYAIYAFIGLILGSVQVGFAAAELGQPVALTVSLAVYAFVGTGIGFVAQANTPPQVGSDA